MRKEEYSVGQLTVDNIIGGGINPFVRRVIYLDPTNGSDGYSGKKIDSARRTMASALSLIQNNRHDMIYYISGTSGITLTAAMFWSTTGLTGGTTLNYSKLCGVNSGNAQGARSRIFNASSGVTPILTVAGTGNYFSDFYLSDSSSDAHGTALVSGSYNRFDRVNFAGPLGNGADTAYRTLTVTGAYNLFKDCVIGLDTAPMSAANGLLSFGAAGVNHPMNFFEDCRFLMQNNTNKTPFFIYDQGTTGQGTGSLFKRCSFINVRGQAQTLTYAISWAETGGGLQHVFEDCVFVGVDDIIATGNVSRAVFTAYGETTTKIGIAQQTTVG